jgi:uncharacterized protein YcnI/copper(I)-binding protein
MKQHAITSCFRIIASLALLATSAQAHVSLEKDEAQIGKSYKAVLKVPHGCDGEPTVAVTLDVPEGYIGVKPMPKAGWKTETKRGDYAANYAFYHGAVLKDGVTSVTWSGGELPDDFYDEFVVNGFVARELKPGPLYFKVLQKCAKGEMSWSEIPAEGVDPHSLKSPAASLTLVAATAEGHDHHGSGGSSGQAGGNDQAIGTVAVEKPWARATPAGAKVGAGYLTLRNTGSEADTLVGIDADFAGRTEIHDMTMTDGVMRMREVPDGLAVAPGGTVELKPGGLHIMFLDLKSPLKAGEPVKAKLKFKSGAEGEVEFSVAPIGAEAPEHKHH